MRKGEAMASSCPECEARLQTDTEQFLHVLMHNTPWGTIHGLNELPFALVPAVAVAMEKFARRVMDDVVKIAEDEVKHGK